MASSDRQDVQYFDELRSRRLWVVARQLCQQQIANNNLSKRQNADWIVRKLRIEAERALHAEPAARDERWQSARDAARQAVQNNRDHPYLLLIRAQDVLTVLARAEALRQEAEVSADRDALLESALTALREADRTLDTLRKDVQGGGGRGSPRSPAEPIECRRTVFNGKPSPVSTGSSAVESCSLLPARQQ